MLEGWFRRRQIKRIQAAIADLEQQTAIIDGDIVTKADRKALENRETELERLRKRLTELEAEEIQNDHEN